MKTSDLSFDVVIVGSGFGGSVSALRLAQKGYKVAVIEKGRRWQSQDFPTSNRKVRKFLWAPLLRCFGIQQISLLNGVMVLHGAGVGGGSLVYANTLMKPEEKVFSDSGWPRGFNWSQELSHHYLEAQRMLGVAKNQLESLADRKIKELGQRLGCEDTYHLTDVGVYFGQNPQEDAGKEVADPYFEGQGPRRTACTGCGACMIGCRVGAKNTLDKNYLYLAEKAGAKVFPELEVDRISGEDGNYRLSTLRSTSWSKGAGPVFTTKKVILAAGVMGTLKILFKNRDVYQTLPRISARLGELVRTNGESLCGITRLKADLDFSKGVAIGSAIHPDSLTKIEPVRYPPTADVMRWLAVPLTGAGSLWGRPLRFFGALLWKWPQWLRLLTVKDWARQSIILLVMQSSDQKMTLKWGRRWFQFWQAGLVGDFNEGRLPSSIPVAQQATQELARLTEAVPQNVISEVLLGVPATAHILGGACMGSSEKDGVIDHHHELFGHPGIYVCDGSVVPVNLGVNPSLTITAMSERFASFFADHK